MLLRLNKSLLRTLTFHPQWASMRLAIGSSPMAQAQCVLLNCDFDSSPTGYCMQRRRQFQWSVFAQTDHAFSQQATALKRDRDHLLSNLQKFVSLSSSKDQGEHTRTPTHTHIEDSAKHSLSRPLSLNRRLAKVSQLVVFVEPPIGIGRNQGEDSERERKSFSHAYAVAGGRLACQASSQASE